MGSTRSGPTIGTAIPPIARGFYGTLRTLRSGDIHSFFANDLKLDFDDQSSPTIATEFVGTSVSSYGPPYDPIAKVLPDNPHVHFFDSRRRGYVLIDLASDAMQAQMRVVSDAHDPKATISTFKTFMVENGRAGVVEA